MDPSREDNEWLRHPNFTHFWKNHAICTEWMKRNIFANHKAQTSSFSPAGASVTDEFYSIEEPEVTERLSRCEIQMNDQDPEIEVMSNEMKEFYAKTHEHRQKLKEKREAEMEKEKTVKKVEYVDIDQISVRGRIEHSTDQRDVNTEFMEKREKAKKDYGDAAMKLLAMESAIEMRFESEFALNPQLWPNIPFRF
ncbi:unnamed protein product [Caenorhabditis brenneri]